MLDCIYIRKLFGSTYILLELRIILLCIAILVVVGTHLSKCELLNITKLFLNRYSFTSRNGTKLVEPFLDFSGDIIVDIREQLRLIIRHIQTFAVEVAQSSALNCDHVANLEIDLLVTQILAPAADTNRAHRVVNYLKEFTKL